MGANNLNTEAILDKLDLVLEQQDIVMEALLGSPKPGSPPGLIRRMDESERDRADIRRQLADLTAAVRTIEATPGKTAITWFDRVGLGLLGLLLSALGALIGATLKNGGPH
jgi:hypothetical protein